MKTLFFLSWVFLSACFQSSSFDTCDRDTQKLVKVDGGEKCLSKCTNDTQCKNDDLCLSRVCAPPGSIISIFVPPDKSDGGLPPRQDLGLSSPDVVAEDLGPTITFEEAQKACQALAAKVVQCTQNECTDTTPTMDVILTEFETAISEETCIASFRASDAFRDVVLNVVDVGCSNKVWREFFCNTPYYASCPTCVSPTKVGDPCLAAKDCSSGDFDPTCIPEPEGFVGGYCSSGCTDDGKPGPHIYKNDTQCGEGNFCFVFEGGVGSRPKTCIKGCQTHADCRVGFACIPLSRDERACLPLNECKECQQGGDKDCCDTKCGNEMGPQGEKIQRCQFSCQGKEICEQLGGQCRPDASNKEYCVLN